MIIDVHTHVFPDDIAYRAIHKLLADIDNVFTPVTEATCASLLARMDEWGIDASVLQPVVTTPKQVKKIDDWVASVATERLIPFGGFHPLSDDYRRDIDYAVSLGLKGLKLHPMYQNFRVDDPELLPVYDYALSRGLILLFHAGYDPAYPPLPYSDPLRFRHVIDEMQGGVIIAGHLGGHAQWDDVEKYLVGTGIYLDTSMGFEYYSQEQFLRIVRAHGADRILFGSDSPWSNAQTEIQHLRALPLTEAEKEAILGQNAQLILGL